MKGRTYSKFLFLLFLVPQVRRALTALVIILHLSWAAACLVQISTNHVPHNLSIEIVVFAVTLCTRILWCNHLYLTCPSYLNIDALMNSSKILWYSYQILHLLPIYILQTTLLEIYLSNITRTFIKLVIFWLWMVWNFIHNIYNYYLNK